MIRDFSSEIPEIFVIMSYDKKTHSFSKQGFTLIELLVVVLIIGILAAVALPQYERAVWKSRAAEMMSSVKSLGQAQDLFHMSTGSWPSSFDDLDIDFSSLSAPTKPNPCAMGGTKREKGFMTLSINSWTVGNYQISCAAFNEGPYKCGGFVYAHYAADPNLEPATLYCWQHASGEAASAQFCESLFSGTRQGTISGWNVYSM